MEIKYVIFDLGKVLIPFDYAPFTKLLNEKEAGLGERFWEFYHENYFYHRDYERGDMSLDEFLAIMLKAVDYKIDGETFCKAFSEIFVVNEDVVSLLPRIARNYRLFLLSNTSFMHRKFGWDKYNFFAHFEKLFLSYEVRAVKPEAKIYEHVMSYTKGKPEEHLFIDDVQDYVDGAKKAGWNAVLFTGFSNLEESLKEFNIKY